MRSGADPRATPVFIPGVSEFSDTGGFLIRGWGAILSGLCLLYAPQPIRDRPVELGFKHRAGRCRPERTRFSPTRCRRLQRYGRISEPGLGPHPPRLRREWGRFPQGQLPLFMLRPMIARGRAGGGGALGQSGWGSKNTQG